jgi:hypothetical protein
MEMQKIGQIFLWHIIITSPLYHIVLDLLVKLEISPLGDKCESITG